MNGGAQDWGFKFALYRNITRLIGLFAPQILNARRKKGKEAIASSDNRFGLTLHKKTQNKLIHIHGASVGESMIGLMLAQKLRQIHPDWQFLFSAQTVTASETIKKSQGANDYFAFAPIDTPKFTNNFVKNNICDLSIFIEGEIWPNWLFELTRQKRKAIFINARMTDKSLKNWQKQSHLAANIFANFAFIHAANKKTAMAIGNILKREITNIGNLKLSAPAPKVTQELIDIYAPQIGARPVWLCASSHEGEEEIIIAAHKLILAKIPNALLIIAPRHLERSNNIIEICRQSNLNYKSKSQEQSLVNNIQILIWDIMGEMGAAFKLANLSFIAGSLLEHIGGHNPLEPAALSCPIICGPYFHNFEDIYNEMEKAQAVKICAANDISIADAVLDLFQNPQNRQKQAQNAREYLANGQDKVDDIIKKIKELI